MCIVLRICHREFLFRDNRNVELILIRPKQSLQIMGGFLLGPLQYWLDDCKKMTRKRGVVGRVKRPVGFCQTDLKSVYLAPWLLLFWLNLISKQGFFQKWVKNKSGTMTHDSCKKMSWKTIIKMRIWIVCWSKCYIPVCMQSWVWNKTISIQLNITILYLQMLVLI